jgi:hypothetical protein
VRAFHHRYSADRRRALIDLIARGIERGEIAPDLDPELATVTLPGAVFYQRLMTGSPFDPGESAQLVALVLGRSASPSALTG